MHRALRLALMWMLLVALPLQGFAAGAMLYCGPAHGQPAAAAADVPAASQGSHADHGDHGRAHHHVADPGDTQFAPLGHLDGGGCSVCASCCSAAALPIFIDLPVLHFEQRSPLVDGHRPVPTRPFTGPDRPPRVLSA